MVPEIVALIDEEVPALEGDANVQVHDEVVESLQEDDVLLESPVVKKLWLVLPGGGIKGVNQLGFIEGFMKAHGDRFVIDRVYGTSVGAVMSPLVAAQKYDVMKEIIASLKSVGDVLQSWSLFENVLKIVFFFTRFGAYKKVKTVDVVLDAINKALPNEEEKLSIFSKCFVVAWDLVNKEEVWFTGKDVPFGMRASSALTVAVPPIEHEGRCFTDGGITELIPITRAKEDLKLQKDKDNICLLVVDCAKRVPRKLKQKPSNALYYMIELLSDASGQLANRELEMVPNIKYVCPDDEVFENALDVNEEKIKKAYETSYKLGESFAL